MASVSSKLFEIFRYLKSDAVPRPPRQADAEPATPRGPRSDPNPDESLNPDQNEKPHIKKENGDESDHEEIIFNEDDFVKDDNSEKEEKKPKFKFPFQYKTGKDPKDPKKPPKSNKEPTVNTVNTQATGSVFNIVNASGVQVGSNHVYYMSAVNENGKNGKSNPSNDIEKDNLITLLMESTIPPTHKYIHFVSVNLGKNWKNFFVTLGYLEGRIDTLEMEKGITEARYKLLREWVDNDEGTLGRLATLLWEEGERKIVQILSHIYNENKK